MNKTEIIAALDRAGIKHDAGSTKQELLELLDAPTPEPEPAPEPAPEPDPEPVGAGASARPVWEGGESRQQYHARVREWKLAQRSDQ